MKRIILIALVALVVAVPAALAGSSTATTSSSKNIVQTAEAAGQFKTLVTLVKKAGLAGALSAPGKLTVFAPTDAAFAKVPKSTLSALLANPAKLKAVLLYHVLKGEVPASKVVKLKSATTLEGAKVKISIRSGSVYVSNGVIHVINSVLIPPS